MVKGRKGTKRHEYKVKKPKVKADSKSKASNSDEEEEQNFQNLDKQLLSHGLFIKKVTGDGNCLFRAISDQLLQSEKSYRTFREGICNYMVEQKDQFAPFIYDKDFDEYIKEMREDKTWGGNLELQAASMCHGVNIVVHQLNAPAFELANHKDAKIIHLSYHDGRHYNSVHAKTETAEKQLCKTDHRDKHPTDEEQVILQATGTTDLKLVRELMKKYNQDIDTVVDVVVHVKNGNTLESYDSFQEQDQVPQEEENKKEEELQDEQIISDISARIYETIGKYLPVQQIKQICKKHQYQFDEVLESVLSDQKKQEEAEKKKSSPPSQQEQPKLTKKQQKEADRKRRVNHGEYLTRKEINKREKEKRMMEDEMQSSSTKNIYESLDVEEGISEEKVFASLNMIRI
ncbi:hypothetical protein AKO1_012292 [Acrasis kona]|uniref:OTU domain-containing protein n=1 Tax=Acrasis kona TaxID=1008807 RepID=A0AAW2ZAR7_9EUKA